MLLIDPFVDESEMYSEYLRFEGFDVVVPPSPKAALRAAAHDPPDVIVTRLRLADSALDGIDVLKHVKGDRATRHVPVMIITTSIRRSDARKAAAARCDAYVLLPVAPDDLAAQIRRLFRESTRSPRKGKPPRRS